MQVPEHEFGVSEEVNPMAKASGWIVVGGRVSKLHLSGSNLHVALLLSFGALP